MHMYKRKKITSGSEKAVATSAWNPPSRRGINKGGGVDRWLGESVARRTASMNTTPYKRRDADETDEGKKKEKRQVAFGRPLNRREKKENRLVPRRRGET